MEDNLNICKMEDDLNVYKWKATSFCFKMEDDLKNNASKNI